METAKKPDGVVSLRPPDQVMRLGRIGAFFPSRLSFMRSLIRRMGRENWHIGPARWELDDAGFGVAVYQAHTGQRIYSLVCFSQALAPERRSDRVIAEEWDSTFALFDGTPSDADIARLARNVPKQEAGRCGPEELVLSRANKSMRLFASVVDHLAAGRQPPIAELAAVGYLMRTTAVYGNGKFGLADRDKIAGRPEMAGPFAAEMLAVYLIRCFTLDLADHVARRRSPDTAVSLAPELRRFLGIGNATGLGMAPFLVTHPVLLNNWIHAREAALARVRSLPRSSPETGQRFAGLLARAMDHVGEWSVDDQRQQARIDVLRRELPGLAAEFQRLTAAPASDRPWDRLYRWAEHHLSTEGQELLLSLMLEPHGDLVDDLTDTMGAPDGPPIDPRMTIGDLKALIAQHYAWAAKIDFTDPERLRHFWYVSIEKLEPRLGDRYEEPGAGKEMVLGVARELQKLAACLADEDDTAPLARFLLARPEVRHMVRRVQIAPCCPYGEIRDNLLDAGMLPIDLLRCKLSFFGASKFDPRSDRWTRITLYQGAPLPDELSRSGADDWSFPLAPEPV